MSTISKPLYDPLKIFIHAYHFHESDHRLRNTVPLDKPEQVPLVAHPAMVLSAFASELYMKCLLCAETGNVPKGHNLKKLFNALQPTTRRQLEIMWDAAVRRPERMRVLDHIRTLPGGERLRLDLQFALDVGADAFIELRYFYEKQDAYFLLSDFPNLLRTIILDRFPKWKLIKPTPPIGPFR